LIKDALESQLTCLHVHNQVAFLEGRLLPSQSEQFKKLSNSSDWPK